MLDKQGVDTGRAQSLEASPRRARIGIATPDACAHDAAVRQKRGAGWATRRDMRARFERDVERPSGPVVAKPARRLTQYHELGVGRRVGIAYGAVEPGRKPAAIEQQDRSHRHLPGLRGKAGLAKGLGHGVSGRWHRSYNRGHPR